ncbi:MAG: restriction endonuclease subunit S [Methanolobus sp.]|nr:restriction endonuclease subunit S [Methanolobus sp.]
MKLPDGWEMHHLRELFSSRKEKGIEGLPTLSVTINNGLVDRSSIEKKTDTNLSPQEHLLIRKGDLAYNMMRMWQGAFGLADYDGLVSPAYVVLSPTDRIDSKFAFYWFKSPRMIYLFWAYSYGLTGDRLRLYFKDFTKIKNIIPLLPEQKAIADMLSTWDEAIEKTERLIQAKEKLFRGLLYSLISNQYSKNNEKDIEWKKVKLGEICEVITSNVDKKTMHGEKHVRLCNYMDVYKNYYITSKLDFMSASATPNEIQKYQLQNHDVLLTKDSETPDDIANSACVLEASENLLCGYHLTILRPKKGLFGPYLNFALHTPRIRYEFSRQANGATRFGLNMSAYNMVELSLPPLEEQKQIAETLSTTQHEIDLLNQLAEKYKTQKRGLMKKMLTGEWRVEEEIIKQYSEA